MTKLALFGVTISVLYVGVISYSVVQFWDQFIELTPNAWGDFLAGTFGPMAIFWLVLGFFQQGQELRLQVKELSLSVEQQKELVGVTRETLDLERALIERREDERKSSLQPKLLITLSPYVTQGPSRVRYKLRVENAGMAATEFKLTVYHDDAATLFVSNNHFKNGDQEEQDNPQFIEPMKGKVFAIASYEDADGDKFRFQCDFEGHESGNNGHLRFTPVQATQTQI